MSFGFQHHKRSLFHHSQKNNMYIVFLIFSFVVPIIAYLIYALVSENQENINPYFILPNIAILCIASVWIFVLILIDEIVKISLRRSLKDDHRKLTIFFDTKLGLHSPR